MRREEELKMEFVDLQAQKEKKMSKNYTQKENPMTSKENKELVRHIFAEIGKGNHQPFLDAVAEDFTVTCIGTTPVSGTYKGIKKVSEEFIGPVMASFESPPTVVVDRIIAEGDFVVTVAHGEGGVSKNGKAYNITYCHVMRLQDGKLVESTEYLDTALVNEAGIGQFGTDQS